MMGFWHVYMGVYGGGSSLESLTPSTEGLQYRCPANPMHYRAETNTRNYSAPANPTDYRVDYQ